MYSDKLLSNKVQKAEEEHTCVLCGEKIYAGEECNILHWETNYGRTFYNYLHLRCNNIVEKYCIENKHYMYADISPEMVESWLKSVYCDNCIEKSICNDVGIFKCEIILRKIYEKWREAQKNGSTCYHQAKYDDGKVRPSLVPPQIIWDIAQVREYGAQKYGDTENWRNVELQRYIDAFYRHWLAFIEVGCWPGGGEKKTKEIAFEGTLIASYTNYNGAAIVEDSGTDWKIYKLKSGNFMVYWKDWTYREDEDIFADYVIFSRLPEAGIFLLGSTTVAASDPIPNDLIEIAANTIDAEIVDYVEYPADGVRYHKIFWERGTGNGMGN